MDRAEEIARRAIEPFRSLFREGAEHLFDGLINSVAGELRGEASRIKDEARAAVNEALTTINRIR